jgi:hypothetical protein
MAGMRILAVFAILSLAGCCHHDQRFVPVGNGVALALDTKTGQQCYTLPKTDDLVPQVKETNGVFCSDLYSGSN